jgi:hypothetical protein
MRCGFFYAGSLAPRLEAGYLICVNPRNLREILDCDDFFIPADTQIRRR